jgi:hypothetical protein
VNAQPDFKALGQQLFAMRHSAVVIPFAQRSLENWMPREKDCHANCTWWRENNPDCTAVRGWLYFDFGGLLNFVRFTAHSVIEQADGVLVDITPSRASQHYPFIRHPGSEDDFSELIMVHGAMNLDYVYR